MSTQDHIIALLHGDLKDESRVAELINQLAASTDSRRLLLEHIELSQRVDRLVGSIVPGSANQAGLWDRIDAFEKGIGSSVHFSEDEGIGRKRPNRRMWGGILLALLAGFGLGYWFGSDGTVAANTVSIHSTGAETATLDKRSETELKSIEDLTKGSDVVLGIHAEHSYQSARGSATAPVAEVQSEAIATAAESSEPTLRVLTPNGGERFKAGSTIPIIWSGSQNDTLPTMLEYSQDGGVSWSEIGIAKTNRQKLWQIPDNISFSAQCLIRVGVVDTLGLNPAFERSFPAHDSLANVAEISPDGRWLATVGADTKVLLWDLWTGQLVRSMIGHTGLVTFAKFNRDGTKFASCSQDGSVRVWDVATGKQEHILMAQGGQKRVTWAVAFSPDGRTVAVTNDDGSLTLWDLGTGVEDDSLAGANGKGTFEPHEEGIRYIEYTPDGTRLLTTSSDMTAAIVDAKTGEVLHRFVHHVDDSLGANPTKDEIREAYRHRIVNGFQLTPDGKTAISCGFNGWVKFWDVESGALIRSERYHGGAKVSNIVLSSDGEWLASVGYDGTTKIIDVHTGEVLSTIADSIEGKSAAMTRASFSKDRRFLAIAHQDGRATLWRLKPLIYSDLSDFFWSIEPCNAAEPKLE